MTVPERTAAAAERITALGAGAVSTDPGLLTTVSSDWSRMSPVLQEKVPPGRYLADVVVRPATGPDVATVLAVAFEHDVPVTPRGAGTGNYGQATPFDGGILLDLRDLTNVSVGETTVTAGAGARLTAVDKVLRAAGRDVWMFPSTKTSTLGGFLGGGSAGTGSIEHGTTSDGFVASLTVAPMDGSGELVTVRGDDCDAYVHAYGVTGVIVSAEVRTDPAREWTCVYAAFDTFAATVDAAKAVLRVDPVPRLCSADEPALVPSLTASVPLDPARYSLRVILEASTLDAVTAAVRIAGGDVVAVKIDYAEGDRLSGMSYNHPVWFLQRAQPERNWFHLETFGAPLWDDPDAVRACYDGPVHLHLEAFGGGPGGMLVAAYQGEQALLDGIGRLEAIGVGVHSPHQWYVDRNVDLVTRTARRTDPKGLLNPGKLPPGKLPPGKLVAAPPVDTRRTIGAA